MIGDNKYSRYIDTATPKEKINYSYSIYYGSKFYRDWELTRNWALSELKQKKSTEFDLINAVETTIIVDSNESALLFSRWYDELGKKKVPVDVLLLLKRFEVTKKIYNRYDENFRPKADASFTNLNNYINFSVILLQAFQLTRLLPFLNGFLKVNDIIVSNVESIQKGHSAKIAEYVLKREIDLIKQIKSKGNV